MSNVTNNPFMFSAPRSATAKALVPVGLYDALISRVAEPARDKDGATRVPVSFALSPKGGGDTINHTERIDTPLPVIDDEGNIITTAAQFPDGEVPARLKECEFSKDEAAVYDLPAGTHYFVGMGAWQLDALCRACGIDTKNGYDLSLLNGAELVVEVKHIAGKKDPSQKYMNLAFRANGSGPGKAPTAAPAGGQTPPPRAARKRR